MKGFTLVEILVALAIGLTVATVAGPLFENARGAALSLESVAEHADQRANGYRLLVRIVAGAEVGTRPDGAFIGRPASLSLMTRLASPDGSASLVAARIVADPPSLLVLLNRDTVTLSDELVSARFDYLPAFGHSQTWLTEWTSSAVPPVALRLRIGLESRVDTLLLAIGPRG